MNKLCMVALCTVSGAYAQMDPQRQAQFQQEFAQSAAAGGVSALTLDFLRGNVLPDATKYKLYDNYGVCRDQLTGELKIAAGAMGIATMTTPPIIDALTPVERMSTRILGLLAGANLAVYLKKSLFN